MHSVKEDVAEQIIQPLSEEQLDRLSKHKYSSQGTSILEPYFQVFWRWLVEQVPLWWAPNAITFVGLLVNISTSLVLVYYSPNGKSEIPGWAFLLCAAGLFIYQALDAIDGKQARRTNNSSPLGELFDHGCDAVSCGYVSIATCIALQMGDWPRLMLYQTFLSGLLFYAAHWQGYCTGALSFGKFDVTETQVGIMSIHLISFLFPGCWRWKFLGCELRSVPIIFVNVGGFLALMQNLRVILFKGGCGKNGSTVAGSSVIFPVFPISAVLIFGWIIYNKSTTGVFEANLCLYILTFATVVAKITCKLVVAQMTKSEISFLDSSLLAPSALFFNQYFDFIFPEQFILWVAFICCNVDILRYSMAVCKQIASHLNIFVFSIRPAEKQK